MKWFAAGFGVLLVMGAVTAARAQDVDLEGAPITIQGCVTSGIEPDTYVLTRVAEVRPDGTVIPRPPLPMPVVYWLDDVSGLKGRVGQRVQVGGKIERVHTSEVEVKQDDDAGLVAELEVPGRDVKDEGEHDSRSGRHLGQRRNGRTDSGDRHRRRRRDLRQG